MSVKTKSMEYSPNYLKVRNYYIQGLWKIERVYNAVGKWITAEEYKEITGSLYVEKS